MTTTPDTQSTDPHDPERALDLRALAIVLVKHYGLHDGRFQVALKFRIGAGAVTSGKQDDAPLPGVVVGVEGVALNIAKDGAQALDVVDAAEVNPRVAAKAKNKAKAK